MSFSANQISFDDIFDACLGAYSDRTIKGYRSDLRVFKHWCESQNSPCLPTSASSVAQFVDAQVEQHSLATVKRRVCAIAFAHRLSDLPGPTEHNLVRLALR